jgi:hypothetical protein
MPRKNPVVEAKDPFDVLEDELMAVAVLVAEARTVVMTAGKDVRANPNNANAWVPDHAVAQAEYELLRHQLDDIKALYKIALEMVGGFSPKVPSYASLRAVYDTLYA